MIRISELIKYYESIKPMTSFDSYFSDSSIDSKIGTLRLMFEAIGDVSLEEDYYKAFMYELRIMPIGVTHMEYIKEIQVLYELCKDVKMSIDDLRLLIACYRQGPYALMFKEIKELIIMGKLSSEIKPITKKAYDISREEAEKLDYLKEEYGQKFIEEIQEIIVEECLSIDRVLEILPSKELIDSSRVDIPGLRYPILSGEDLVIRRLRYLDVEREYQETMPESIIKLGYCSHGDTVFTSFTKKEYEEDLKAEKKLIRKK